jgi:hypothetical protein
MYDVKYNYNGPVVFKIKNDMNARLLARKMGQYNLYDLILTNKKLIDLVVSFNDSLEKKNIIQIFDEHLLFLNNLTKQFGFEKDIKKLNGDESVLIPYHYKKFYKKNGDLINYISVGDMIKQLNPTIISEILQYHFFYFTAFRYIKKYPMFSLVEPIGDESIVAMFSKLGLENCKKIFSKLLLCIEGLLYLKKTVVEIAMPGGTPIINTKLKFVLLPVILVEIINNNIILHNLERIAYYFCLLKQNNILNPSNKNGEHIHEHLKQIKTYDFNIRTIRKNKPTYFQLISNPAFSDPVVLGLDLFDLIANILADDGMELGKYAENYALGIFKILADLEAQYITDNMKVFIDNLYNNKLFKELSIIKIKI